MSSAPIVAGISLPLITRRVRAFFAPVNRALKQPTIFDPAVNGGFALAAPPTPWMDLGWIEGFARSSETKIAPLSTGSPATALYQVREREGATVSFQFKTWSKLTMALAGGAQHMNVLAPPAGGVGGIGSGAKASPALGLSAGSSATSLNLAATPTMAAGDVVVVDTDYLGQVGFVGSGVSAAYVRSAGLVGGDPDYIRRVSFNVSRVTAVSGSTLQLSQPLIAGAPTAGMKVQRVLGFVDREGGSFFQEWSALFVMQGEQGDRLLFHYPRLQAMAPAHETSDALLKPLSGISIGAAFRALPVSDGNDGEQVLCYRTYMPGAQSLV